MAQYDGMVLTNDGINLLAKCQLGQKIEFTKVLIGDGRVSEGKTFQEMTALVNTKLALGIQNVDFVEDGRVDVTAIIDNSGLEVGFFVREIGLFAKPVGGAEVLYAYTNAGDLADYLPNAKVNEVTDQIVVQSIITNKENVVININNNFVVATKADLKKHDESVNVHVNLMDAHNADESAHEPAFTAHNEDEGAHENRFSQYVKRSGDVMTAKRAMVRDVNNSNIFICGGKDEFSGAYLQAYGADEENFGGAFVLAANKDTNSSMLKGCPSGELSWGGKPIVRSVNGVGANSAGNVDIIPAGTMQMFAGNTIPAGWLLCDGSAVSRTDYAKLFSAIGTIYGKGNNSTTFALPNLIDRVVQGATTAGTYKEAGLPNIEGELNWQSAAGNYTGMELLKSQVVSDGALSVTKTRAEQLVNDSSTMTGAVANILFDASQSNAIYGNSITVQPPALTMLPIIKY